MATNSTTMTSDAGYKTTMTLSADFTGRTSGNTREVKAVLSLYFADSAYGAYAYAPVTYALSIPGASVEEWAPTRVERATTYTVTKTAYVKAGESVNIKGYAYVSWSDANFAYPPNPNNGGSLVSVTLTSNALQSVINSAEDFVLEDSFCINTTKYDESFTDVLDIKAGEVLIKHISDYESGNVIKLDDDELLSAYETLGENNTSSFTFVLTTKNGTDEIGTSAQTATGVAKGTARVKESGGWRRGIVWIKADGVWKKGIMSVNVNGWRRGV